jgi:hypothetical protein
MTKKQPFSVEYVNGDLKYGVAPIYSEKARQDDLRKLDLSGSKNKPKRKLLGEHDAIALMEMRGDKGAIEFLENLRKSTGVDQVHDVTDSYLIAAVAYEQDRGVKVSAGKGKKRVTKKEQEASAGKGKKSKTKKEQDDE